MDFHLFADGSVIGAAIVVIANAAITWYRVKNSEKKVHQLSTDFYGHHDNRTIHRDPERDRESAEGLLRQINESRLEICRRLEKLEQCLTQIKINDARHHP
jgi:hypothetical protein